MSKKSLIIIVIILGIILVTKALLPKGAALLDDQKNIPEKNTGKRPTPVTAVGMEYGGLIRETMAQVKPLQNLPYTNIGITSHHLPTAVNLIGEFYATLKNAPGPKSTFVIIGPDHFERCEKPVSTTKRAYTTPFGELESQEEIINDLLTNGANQEDGCFDGEHSIGVQAMFVKYLYPQSRIVPITLSSGTTDEAIESIVRALAKRKEEITIIVSVDFSHYQNVTTANSLDSQSGTMIKNLDGSGLTLEHMDSPPSIKLAIAFAKATGATLPHLLKHQNSYDIIKQSENTTGYWDIFFTTPQ